MPDTRAVAQQKHLLMVIWGAMLAAVATYGAVCLLVVGPVGTHGESQDDMGRYALTAVAIVLGGGSYWWRRRFLSQIAREPAAATELARIQSYAIVLWAASEAVAVCGLVLAFVIGNFWEFVPFGVASIALLALHRPSTLPFRSVLPS
jgi:hypothetical protein